MPADESGDTRASTLASLAHEMSRLAAALRSSTDSAAHLLLRSTNSPRYQLNQYWDDVAAALPPAREIADHINEYRRCLNRLEQFPPSTWPPPTKLSTISARDLDQVHVTALLLSTVVTRAEGLHPDQWPHERGPSRSMVDEPLLTLGASATITGTMLEQQKRSLELELARYQPLLAAESGGRGRDTNPDAPLTDGA